jgi:hypothetical protein
MKFSNLNCNHGIGLVSYQRRWFEKRRFCSKKCRLRGQDRVSRNDSSAAISTGYLRTPRCDPLRVIYRSQREWLRRHIDAMARTFIGFEI